MKEQLISFETAKLAKEKKFYLPCHSYYFEDGEFKEFEINDTYGYYGDEFTVNREEFYNNWNDKWKTTKEGDRCFGCDNKPRYLETFSAPTQSLLQKWLRDVHKIDIYILGYGFGYYAQLNNVPPANQESVKYVDRRWNMPPKDENSGNLVTYEEALEKGLQEALKLIKDENSIKDNN